MEAGRLGVGEERVWPPDLRKHLVADAELILRIRELETRIVPVLAKVEIQREILGINDRHRSVPEGNLLLLYSVRHCIVLENLWHALKG